MEARVLLAYSTHIPSSARVFSACVLSYLFEHEVLKLKLVSLWWGP